MEQTASEIIDGYGGTTAVARLLKSPISTVHSWRSNGIPAARRDHLELAAKAAGVAFSRFAVCDVCDLRAEEPQVSSCTDVRCPMRQAEAA